MTAPYAAPINVVQAAMHRIGETAIASLEDDTSAARIVASNYEGIVADLLTRHAWSWATKTVDLTLTADVPALPWAYAYTPPADVLNIRWITAGGIRLREGDWTYQDGQVLALRSDALQAVVTYRVNEGRWPGDFAEIAVERVRALFMQGLLDKWQEAQIVIDQLDGKPGRTGRIARAIIRDKRQFPSPRADTVPLADAHRGARVRTLPTTCR